MTATIDCFELFIEKPGNLTGFAFAWSNYKSQNTAKDLIGVTPQGTIYFISRGWVGRASEQDIRIIKHSRKLLLFHLEQTWNKKEIGSCFDVTTSSCNGAEICELVGIFTQKTDKIRKKMIQVFKDNGFSIDIVTNLMEVNFLEVTFNLRNG